MTGSGGGRNCRGFHDEKAFEDPDGMGGGVLVTVMLMEGAASVESS